MIRDYIILIIIVLSLQYNKTRIQHNSNKMVFLNAWKPKNSLIYEEFITALCNTNIMSESDSYSIARDNQTKDMLKKIGFKNIQILQNFDEFNMLEMIINNCNKVENYNNYVLYFHFKGSYHNNKRNDNLRKMLIYYVITNYEKCIKKLKNGTDVCGSRYSLLPYRHYSGNMWWSKCKYIKTLKSPKYTILGKRFSAGFYGYTGDRCAAEKWIMSNSQSIPSDLMSDDIDFSFDYGNEYLYKTWITKVQDIQYAPNMKILYSTVKYNKFLNFYPHTYYILYFNLIYDYEVYFNFNKEYLFNLGWCKGLLASKLYNDNNYDNESINVVKTLIEYCKIVKGLEIKNVNNKAQKYKISYKDIIYLSNLKCNEYNNSNNEYDIICNENEDINNDYQVIYDICTTSTLNRNIYYYSQNYNEIYNLRMKCNMTDDFCGKWFIFPFRGNNIGWKSSCKFIRNAGKPKYYLYEGIKLEEDDSFYGFNKYSYLHWPLTNPFQSGICDKLNKSLSNIQILLSILLNSVFDIQSNIINKNNIHKCYWWCNCFSFDKKDRIKKSLQLFCNVCSN